MKACKRRLKKQWDVISLNHDCDIRKKIDAMTMKILKQQVKNVLLVTVKEKFMVQMYMWNFGA
jgi:hypothetical protein